MGFFAELLGGLLSAPVAAAGAATKGAGDALQIGAKDMPLVGAIGGVMSDLGAQALAGAQSIREGISADGGAAVSGAAGSIAGLGQETLAAIQNIAKQFHGAGKETPEPVVGVSNVAEMKVAATATPYDCTLNDVCVPNVGRASGGSLQI